MSDKLITISSFENYLEAEIAKGRLEDADIKSVIVGQDAANLYGLPAVGFIELQVFEKDAEKALEILKAKIEQGEIQQEEFEEEEND
jgi:hypothetical protein